MTNPVTMTMMTRNGIVAAARGWIGTPYRHQASVKGAGTDCLGLIRGVWRETMGEEPETPPAYTPDWAETPGGTGAETLAEAAGRMIHAWSGRAVVETSLGRWWRARAAYAFRFPGLEG